MSECWTRTVQYSERNYSSSTDRYHSRKSPLRRFGQPATSDLTRVGHIGVLTHNHSHWALCVDIVVDIINAPPSHVRDRYVPKI